MYVPRAGLSRLVTLQRDPEVVTARKDCGARKAAARGLAEYLQQLSFEGAGGRQLAFKAVEATFGNAWEPGELPAANVHGGAGDADYDGARSGGGQAIDGYDRASDEFREARFRRTDQPNQRIGTLQQVAIFSPSSFEALFVVEVWAADEAQRDMLEHLLEDDLNPTPHGLPGGIRLELPHYCGARADYHVEGSSISFEGSEARGGLYKSRYQVRVTLDMRVFRQLPEMRPRVAPVVNGETPDPVP